MKACMWRYIARLSMAWMERRMMAAAGRADFDTANRWLAQYKRMQTTHADLCEAIQHMRAAR